MVERTLVGIWSERRLEIYACRWCPFTGPITDVEKHERASHHGEVTHAEALAALQAATADTPDLPDVPAAEAAVEVQTTTPEADEKSADRSNEDDDFEGDRP